LWLVNDGPFRPELEKAAAATGVSSKIRFLGMLPKYSDVLKTLSQAHVLMHPALHEGFGNVCLEALAVGRPVCCLNIGGPASQITPETGFAAPAGSPAEAITAMAQFLGRIDKDRALLARMSASARQRVREKFTMRWMGRVINGYYEQAGQWHAEDCRLPAAEYALAKSASRGAPV